MAIDGTGKAILGAAAIFGAGYLFGRGANRRSEAKKYFRNEFERAGYNLSLVDADLGMTVAREPIWHVTVLHPVLGVRSLSAQFGAGVAGYSQETLDQVVARLGTWLNDELNRRAFA